jgi:hypothetical protein
MPKVFTEEWQRKSRKQALEDVREKRLLKVVEQNEIEEQSLKIFYALVSSGDCYKLKALNLNVRFCVRLDFIRNFLVGYSTTRFYSSKTTCLIQRFIAVFTSGRIKLA